MREITDQARVMTMIREKQQLEIMLAWELLEVFNNPRMGLLPILHKLVRKSIDVMDEVALDETTITHKGKETTKGELFHDKWDNEWAKYYFKFGEKRQPLGLGKGIKWNAQIIREVSVSKFNAQQCSDWIRVFGEVIEEVVQGGSDRARRAFQQGDAYHWKKYKHDHIPLAPELPDGTQPPPLTFQEKIERFQAGAGRRRVKGKDHTDEQLMPDYAREDYHSKRKQVLGNRLGPIQNKTATTWGFIRDIHQASGVNKWRVMKGDTTGRMDQVFGLMPAATISGTTTDNIYFFKRFGQLGLDPAIYLLPTATIVGLGHHSLLEVALPLMLNDVCDYKVGLYSTLFPRRTNYQGAPIGVSQLRQALQAAEDNARNHLMLIYYKGNKPAGCFVLNKNEWDKIVTGNDLMRVFNALPPFPTKFQVKRLWDNLSR